jgi:hypothetical protein
MTRYRRSLAVALGFCLLGFCSGCKRLGQANVVVDYLTTPNGNCVQTVNGSAVNYVQLGSGDKVTWTMPSATTSCNISFTNTAAACPFYSSTSNQCSYTCTNGTVTSAGASGSSGTKYPYASWNVGGTNCPVGSDGLVMK